MSGGSTKHKTLAVFEVTIFLAVLMAIAHLALPSGPTWLRHLSITLLWTIPPLAYVILAGVSRVRRDHAERLAQVAEHSGRVVGVRLPPDEDDDAPWTVPPSRRHKEPAVSGVLPASIEVVQANQLYVPKDGLNPGLGNRLLRVAAFQNPEFYTAQAMRLSTFGKPRVVACAEDHPHHIGLPRGCLGDVRAVLDNAGVRAVVRDERQGGTSLDVYFHGELRVDQHTRLPRH
ncbi:MAG: hypothetical protein MUE61_18800 [Vicinamibacterales bacterium]|nr:hypothetical protein [Vicinamibacterales bacterium]